MGLLSVLGASHLGEGAVGCLEKVETETDTDQGRRDSVNNGRAPVMSGWATARMKKLVDGKIKGRTKNGVRYK